MANWGPDGAYSHAADGGSMARSAAMDSAAGRPRAWSLPDWQFPGRSTPLVSGPDAFFGGASILPETSDPAVGLLDPLYDEVLNCDLSTEPNAGSRAPIGRSSEMSLEHSFDQTQLMRGNSADTRPLFPLSEAQPTLADEPLMLGSAPARGLPDRRSQWQPALYAPFGNAEMYDSMFRADAEAASVRGQPTERASMPHFQQQAQRSMGSGEMMPGDRRVLASFDSSHCAQAGLTSSLPQAQAQGAPRSRALGDAAACNMQLPQLGSLLSSQSAPVSLSPTPALSFPVCPRMQRIEQVHDWDAA